MARQPADPWHQEILDALCEGRITAATAATWQQMRIDAQAREAREVRAHATEQLRTRLHSAVAARCPATARTSSAVCSIPAGR
ncbi:MAG TPA: hypothetical protein VGQ26_07180 [Streptosporangiaceae bacterium]|jgi:hypothetical protein|nr:hypothetical protein [Streptosporangiaceae bacterium]